jgi:hypothetical protein
LDAELGLAACHDFGTGRGRRHGHRDIHDLTADDAVSTWFIARLVNTLISAAPETVGTANAIAKPIVPIIREK